MNEQFEVVLEQGAALTFSLGIPLVLVAAACGVLASMLGGLVGVQDQSAPLAARTFGVLLVVVLLGTAGWQGIRTYATDLWGGMHEVGRPSEATP